MGNTCYVRIAKKILKMKSNKGFSHIRYWNILLWSYSKWSKEVLTNKQINITEQSPKIEVRGMRHVIQAVLPTGGDKGSFHKPCYSHGWATPWGKPAPAGPVPEVRHCARSEHLQGGHSRSTLLKLFSPAPKLPRWAELINERSHISHICHKSSYSTDWDSLFGSHFHQGMEWGKCPWWMLMGFLNDTIYILESWTVFQEPSDPFSHKSPVMWV